MKTLAVSEPAGSLQDSIELIGIPEALTSPTGSRTPPAVRGTGFGGTSFPMLFSVATGGALCAPSISVAWGFGATGSVNIVSDAQPFYPEVATVSPLTHLVSAKFDLSASSRIDLIRNHLSLTMTQLATVVGVTRTTLYVWVDQATTSPRERHQRRLGALARIASRWAGRSAEPVGGYLTTPLPSGSALLELLSARRWNMRAIGEAIDTIAAAIEWARGFKHAHDHFDNLRSLVAERAKVLPTAMPIARHLAATKTSRPDEDLEPDYLTWSEMAAVGVDERQTGSQGRPRRRRR